MINADDIDFDIVYFPFLDDDVVPLMEKTFHNILPSAVKKLTNFSTAHAG